MRSGGQVLIDQLRRNGLQRLFTVPGESFLSVLDALHDADGVDLIVCRQEGGAAMMADATARLAGPKRPAAGVALVSRGPGLANAMSGLHVAMQGATAMLVLVGLPSSSHEGRGGFQEIDIAGLEGSFAKHVETVRDAERIPEIVARALVIAHAGRPGPCVIGLPEDVLSAETEVEDPAPVVVAEPRPGFEDLNRMADLILSAEWPVLVVGGRWEADARMQLQAFAERLDLPVVASFRCQDAFDNRSASYCGHAGFAPSPKLKAALTSADLVVVVGTHIDEITAGGYETLTVPSPRQKLVHVHPAADVPGRNHTADLAMIASNARLAERLDDVAPSIRPGMTQRWSRFRSDLRAAYESWRRIPASPGALRLEDVVGHLSSTLPEDAIITNGAGNYAAFLHRAFTYKGALTQLAPISGSMGYGLPAAIAAKLAHPERDVVCVAGDGCLQMTVQELATAVQYGVAITILVADNRMHGTIRAAQERRYPGRVIGTSLVNPDFANMAQAYGAAGINVSTQSDYESALTAALAAATPTILALQQNSAALAPGVNLPTYVVNSSH